MSEDNSPYPMKKALFDLANNYEKEAESQNDKFNKGYFEGKAEMARLVISCLGVSDRSLVRDILNGDIR